MYLFLDLILLLNFFIDLLSLAVAIIRNLRYTKETNCAACFGSFVVLCLLSLVYKVIIVRYLK